MRNNLFITALILLLLLVSCNKSGNPDGGGSSSSTRAGIKIGDTAPDFTLPGFPQQEFTLSDHLAQQAVVLYFYPKDNTPDCSAQACAFRDMLGEFSLNQATIVGISRDDLASHALFADEYDIPFPLLFDQNGAVRELYGNPDGSTKLIPRISYIIDRKGAVSEIISGDQVSDLNAHVLAALEAVKRLSPT